MIHLLTACFAINTFWVLVSETNTTDSRSKVLFLFLFKEKHIFFMMEAYNWLISVSLVIVNNW